VPIDTTQPGSDGWWLLRLSNKLHKERPEIERLASYMDGDPVPPEGAPALRTAIRLFQRKCRTNLAHLSTEAVRQRMLLTGFRTAAPSDDLGDKQAWDIWKGSHFGIQSADVNSDMLALRAGYAIVGPPAKDEPDLPVMTREDPRCITTADDPVRPWIPQAALKLWHDDWGDTDFAYLYLPGRLRVASRPRRGTAGGAPRFNASSWEWDEDRSAVLPFDQVPVVKFSNRGGKGDYERQTDDLDRINDLILKQLTIITFQAFRQRAIKGELPEHDDQGRVIDYDKLFSADPAALWLLPESAELWESGQADLTPVLSSVKDAVQQYAAATQTPLYWIIPDSANGSAMGAAAARESTVFKTGDRIGCADPGYARLMALAFLWLGDTVRGRALDIEPLWAPPDRPSLAERYDAASKAGPAGVPWRTIMTDILGFAPTKVQQMESERADDLFLAPQLASVQSLRGSQQTSGFAALPSAPASV
jgi:hypothetical protein